MPIRRGRPWAVWHRRPLASAALPPEALPPRRVAERIFLVPFGSIGKTPIVDPTRLVGKERIDVFCRCVIASLMCSRRVRRDTTFVAALAKPAWTTRVGKAILESLDGALSPEAEPTGLVKVSGAQLEMLCPDEQWVGATLAQLVSANGRREAAADDAADDAAVGKHSLRGGLREERVAGWCFGEVASLRQLMEDLIAPAPKATRIFVLREDGEQSARVALQEAHAEGAERLVFVLGDHVGLRPAACGRLVDDYGARAVTLGETPLLTSHCITVLQHLADSQWPAVASSTRAP